MSSLRNAAILLMSLPEDDAAALMGRLDSKLVEQVSIEIARINAVPADEQVAAIREFAACNPALVGAQSGGLSMAEALVQKALGKNASGTLSSIRQSLEEIPFGFLQSVDSQNILTYINDEHPQTIALIVSHLPPSFGAEILAGLPSERQLSVVRRVANMGQTHPEIIEEVEAGLERRMASVMRQSYQHAGGVEAVAEMLNVTDRQTERALLENLAQEDADLVEEIRRRMFVFEDVGKFGDKEIQAVLKQVESNQWALALKGASEDLKERIFGNMSKRAATMLREEMDFMGPVKLSAVEAMQQEIVDIIRLLEDSGEIEIGGDDKEDQLVA